MLCCTSAGCTTGMHGTMPIGQPHVVPISDTQTLYIAPTYVTTMNGELVRLPIKSK